MEMYTYTLPSGAKLVGYLRDETIEMPAFNTRPAMLILPGGGYAYCSAREADPVAMQFLQAGYNVFTLYYTCRISVEQSALHWQPLIDAAGAVLHIRRHAQALRIDPAKIAVCGFSGGGHLGGVHCHPVGRRAGAEGVGHPCRGGPPERCCAGLPGCHQWRGHPRRLDAEPLRRGCRAAQHDEP